MANDTIDLLQIKIENAKKQLPQETLDAIASVPWQAEILKMRETKGYRFEQLEDLVIETELVLCGLVSPENYSKELKNRMKLSEKEVNELLNEMNKQVFSKIKEELIKKTNTKILNSAGIEIIPEKLELTTPVMPAIPLIFTQKLSGSVKNEIVKTNHSLNNLTPSGPPSSSPNKPIIDPYREMPE